MEASPWRLNNNGLPLIKDDMSKHIPDAKRGEIQYVAPDWPYIIGIDSVGGVLHTKRGPESEEGCHPLYDDRIKLPVDENLVKNILVYGIQEAVKVRKNGTHDDGTWILEIVDGRQRTKACRAATDLAEKTGVVPPRLKIEVLKVDEAKAVDIGMLCNEQRQDNGLLGKAKDASYLLNIGRTEEEVSLIFGVDKQTIINWQLIIELAPAIKEAIAQGKVAPTAAKELHELTHVEQIAKLKEILEAGHKPTAKNIKRVTSGARPKKIQKLLTTPRIRKLVKAKCFDQFGNDAKLLLRIMAGEEVDFDEIDNILGFADFLNIDPPPESTDDDDDDDDRFNK